MNKYITWSSSGVLSSKTTPSSWQVIYNEGKKKVRKMKCKLGRRKSQQCSLSSVLWNAIVGTKYTFCRITPFSFLAIRKTFKKINSLLLNLLGSKTCYPNFNREKSVGSEQRLANFLRYQKNHLLILFIPE